MEYLLVSVTKDGREYSRCTLEIDEERRYVQVKGKRTFGRGLVQLVDFYYDASTPVEVNDERVKVADLEMVAQTRAEAQSMAASIRKPAVEARRQSEAALREIEAAVEAFLDAREGAISTLLKLKREPRATLLEASAAWESVTGDPVEQLYAAFHRTMTSSKEQMDGLIGTFGWKVGTRVVELLYAYCYVVGKLQDAFYAGSGEDVERAKKFLTDLGLSAADLAGMKLEGCSKTVIRLSHEVLVPAIELPKQAPERSELLDPPKSS